MKLGVHVKTLHGESIMKVDLWFGRILRYQQFGVYLANNNNTHTKFC